MENMKRDVAQLDWANGNSTVICLACITVLQTKQWALQIRLIVAETKRESGKN